MLVFAPEPSSLAAVKRSFSIMRISGDDSIEIGLGDFLSESFSSLFFS